MRERFMRVGKDTKGRVHYYQTVPEYPGEIPQRVSIVDGVGVTHHVALEPKIDQEEKVVVLSPSRETVTHQIPLGSKPIHRYVSFVEDEKCGWDEREFSRHDESPFGVGGVIANIGEMLGKEIATQTQTSQKSR